MRLHPTLAPGNLAFGLPPFGNGLARYSVEGIAPSLVLDFVTQTYAVDPGGWAEVYAVGGQRPSLVLDFVNQEYGA